MGQRETIIQPGESLMRLQHRSLDGFLGNLHELTQRFVDRGRIRERLVYIRSKDNQIGAVFKFGAVLTTNSAGKIVILSHLLTLDGSE